MRRWILILIATLFVGGCMSGAIIYTPNPGSDWATAWEQVEYTRKGKLGLSLTNYTNDSLPAVASGSWAEVAGSIYKWTGEEAISGSLSSNAINYVKLVPSGSGDTAIITATWTTASPTWSDAYQGYYDGTSRYAAAEYYDGTNHKLKWILESRIYSLQIVTVVIPYVGTYFNDSTMPNGFASNAVGLGNGDNLISALQLPHKGIITEFQIYVSADLSGSSGAQILRNEKSASGAGDVMAGPLYTTGSDTSISYPEIDNESYKYWLFVQNDSGTTRSFYGAHVKVVTRFPKVELY